MFKLVFLLITLICFNFDTYADDEVGVRDDYFPKMPVPPPPPELGIEKNIKGIIISDPTGEMWQNEYKEFQGVKIVGITVPGGNDQLQSRIQPYIRKALSVENLEALKWEIVSYYKEEAGIDIFVEMTQDYISTGVVELIIIEPFSNLTGEREDRLSVLNLAEI